jgi:hypothetical protein
LLCEKPGWRPEIFWFGSIDFSQKRIGAAYLIPDPVFGRHIQQRMRKGVISDFVAAINHFSGNPRMFFEVFANQKKRSGDFESIQCIEYSGGRRGMGPVIEG